MIKKGGMIMSHLCLLNIGPVNFPGKQLIKKVGKLEQLEDGRYLITDWELDGSSSDAYAYGVHFLDTSLKDVGALKIGGYSVDEIKMIIENSK